MGSDLTRDAANPMAEPEMAVQAVIDDIYPLSAMQQGMLFHSLSAPDQGMYVQQLGTTFEGDLDLAALERAWQHVVDRHPVLRTSFLWEEVDEPVQVVERHVRARLERLDWRGLAPDEQQRRLEAFRDAERERGLPPAQAPLMRMALIRLGEETYRFDWTVHHLILDGWSVVLLLQEVLTFYDAIRRGTEALLPLPRPYRDYIEWLGLQDRRRAEAFWRAELAGVPPTPLALLSPPAARRSEPDVQDLLVEGEAMAALQALTRRHQLTLNTVVQGAWALLLSRYSGEPEVVFGSVSSGRPADLAGAEGMIGLFLNTLPQRVRVTPESPLGPWLKDLQAHQAEARQLGYLPLAEIQQLADLPAGAPLFETLVDFHNQQLESSLRAQPGGLRATGTSLLGSVNYPLILMVAPGRELLLQLHHDTGRVDAAPVVRMLRHLSTLLAGFADPERRLGDLSLLTEAESRQLVRESTGRAVEIPPDTCAHQLFERQARRTPGALALICGDERLTYGTLDALADRLASSLRGLGVGPDARVGIALDRSPALMVALLAVLKAGGAYVPLDLSHPRERLAYILEDAGVAVLLSREPLVRQLPRHSARLLLLDEPAAAVAAPGDDGLPAISSAAPAPENLAYVLYTSGSTGKPKGVMVPHRGLVNYLSWCAETYPLAEGDVPVHSPIGFDLTVTSLFYPLAMGRTIHLLTEDNGIDAFETLLGTESRFSLLKLTPSHLEALGRMLASSGRSARVGTLVVGGEALSAEHLEPWSGQASEARIFNEYGPTETVVGCSVHEVTGDEPGPIPIGRPIQNTWIHLLDRNFHPVPAGVPGELYVGGAGVTRGYLNRPDLTAERFVPDPLAGRPGERLYRTGDLARRRENGELEFLGRADTQVKIRGFRIELGEIEAALGAHPGVREAVVVAREAGPGDLRLVAYWVAREGWLPSARELGEFLGERLPEYMVPGQWVWLEKLPLSPNGKVDRRAMPAPELVGVKPGERLSLPRTPVEEVLGELWAELLGTDQVGLEDDFFRLGGHSLLAVRLISRVRRSLGVELILRDLLEAPTLGGLAARVEAGLRTGKPQGIPELRPVGRDGELPLSFAQQRLWFLDQLEPGSTAYNLFAGLRLAGKLSLPALAGSLAEVIRRHESLRTGFAAEEGRPRQVIAGAVELPFSRVDLQALGPARQQRELLRLAGEEARRPFDLTRAPLLRVVLAELGSADRAVLLTMHHIVSDGWSMRLLLEETTALYRALLADRPSPLPELAIQYADYACWQRSWLSGEVLEAELDYWRRQLAGARGLELLGDRPRPAVLSHRGGTRSRQVGRDVWQKVREAGRKQGVTSFMGLLAAFDALLSRYTGQLDVTVGTPVSGRNWLETERLIGFLINTLVLRTALDGDPGVGDLLARVRKVLLEAHAHQEVPFEKLVEELQPQRDRSRTPLFEVLLVLQEDPMTGLELEGVKLSLLEPAAPAAQFDLTVSGLETGGGLLLTAEYRADLFDGTTIERLLGHLETLLRGMSGDAKKRVSELAPWSPAERHQVLVEWHEPDGELAGGELVHRLFEEQAGRRSGDLAVVAGEERLTYGELEERSNRLARYLGRLGVGPETRVALAVERSAAMVTALLGVLKAGGVYVPLDPSYPAARLGFMLEDSGAALLLASDRGILSAMPAGAARAVCLDEIGEELAAESPAPPDVELTAANLAYVIYTSGSTGQPKGVAIPHGAVVSFLRSMARRPGLAAGEVLLAVTSLSFDIAGLELYLPLSVGAAVAVVSREVASDGGRLLAALDGSGASVLQATPSTWRLLLEVGWSGGAGLRVLCGGEALPRALAAELSARSVSVWNLYGPTETTIWSAVHRLDGDEEGPAPIGRPIDGTQLYLLDARGNPVLLGAVGELYIGGVGLARGYVNRPDLTAERFVPSAFSSRPGARLYRTGDLGRHLADGRIQYLGRVDQQVKLRGFRIELEEIESVLGRLAEVGQAVVAYDGEAGGDGRLVAYLVEREGRRLPSPEELRRHLRAALPDYMLPALFVRLDSLPLTLNGKVDRRGLPAPGQARRVVVSPRNATEIQLAVIWGEILGIDATRSLGVEDSFFDIGGHSLLAVRLMARLGRQFGRELPLATLFETPTIAAMARLLEGPEEPGQASPLVAVQPAGSRPPLFCVHPIGGNVLCYIGLARHLGPDQPVWGLAASGLSQVGESHPTIEQMASSYLEALRTVQPQGPYRLCGYSFGGIVAFEMACQLQARGEEVALLALLDTGRPVPAEAFSDDDYAAEMAGLVREYAEALGQPLALAAQDLLGKSRDEQLVHILELLHGQELVPPEIDLAWMRTFVEGHLARLAAVRAYQPRSLPVRITLFRAQPDPQFFAELSVAARAHLEDPVLGWSDLVSEPVDIREVPGFHGTLLYEPHVATLGRKLDACLTFGENHTVSGQASLERPSVLQAKG